jgi:hypothetical protein
MDTRTRLLVSGKIGWRGSLLLASGLLLLPWACAPASSTDQELHKDIQGLKTEVTALKEQVAKLAAGQKEIIGLLEKRVAAPAPAPAPVPAPEALQALPQPQAAQPLTVSQLLAGKDRYLGTRVTVKGMVGTVLIHHKSFTFNSPQGLVEVFFDKLPDARQVQRLSSTNIDQPVTVTGMVSLPPKGSMKLQINAESVDF